MASHLKSQGPDRRRQRGQRTGITRVRTGCMTCRKRRKKCDERRPKCLNCEKTNVHCEGFPQTVHWEARNPLRRSSSVRSVPAPVDTDTQNSPVDVNGTPFLGSQPCGGCSTCSPAMQTSSLNYPGTETGIEDLEHNLDFLFDYHVVSATFEEPSFHDTVSENFERYHGGYRNPPGDFSVHKEQGMHFQGHPFFNFQQKTILSPELPFPISGVDTPVHRRLFCHFTAVMTSILTTFAADCNPFKTVIIPLALGDGTLMKTILCLAGAHLLKAQNQTTPDMELVRERARLHDGTVHIQSNRVESMRKHIANSSHQHEAILATSLLLCLYEICIGSGDNIWRTHLDMARHVINLASTPTKTSDATTHGATLKTELNPFLLEFFVYHDSLATVTVPQASKSKPHFDSLDSLPVQNSSLVGVQDGLVEFIERISMLRNQAEASTFHPDGNVVCKATAIWNDLSNWKPNPGWAQSRHLITTFYQRALVIWLFSILNPDGKADPKIQNEVHNICIGMADIKPGDGVMACLLFPLFIVATAAITSQDRDSISGHFRRLKAWSALGNVDLTFRTVKKMWEDHDNSVPGSWDWVKQLQIHNLSFMVT